MRWFFLLLIIALSVIPVYAEVCQNGEERVCGETSVGECRLGKQTCIDGSWSICKGVIYPSDEVCNDNKDNNCNGEIDESCECIPDEQESCGLDVGICSSGTRTCIDGLWSACEGSVQPLPTEICDDNKDNNCNGEIDEGCRKESCFDNIQNQNETDVDCGGPCPACVAATCFDNTKNQGELDVDCGGPCPGCITEQPVVDNDRDKDTLTDEIEVMLGTSPSNPDSDNDGINDNLDKLPLCPNLSCDLDYGETSENCPEDCAEERGFSFFYALIVLAFVVVLLFIYLYHLFRKSTKEDKDDKKGPEEKVLVELRDLKGKGRKSKTEEKLDKSFKKAEKIFRK